MTERVGLVTFGETMGLIRVQDVGPLEIANRAVFSIGGAESNLALGLARLGERSTWVGRVGPDAAGDLIVDRLRANGVRVHAIRDAAPTGLMVRHHRYFGNTQVDYHRAGSAASRLGPDDVPVELVSAAMVLHVTGITPALSASADATVEHAVAVARAAGTLVSVDLNYRARMWTPDRAGARLATLGAAADILFAGVAEARLALGLATPGGTVPGTTAPAAAADENADLEPLVRKLAALGPRQVILKLGRHGCLALVDDVLHRVPAVPVQALDPVGAGDAFAAGYLAELLAGRPAADRLATAVRMGAYAVCLPGDCEGLPTRAELDAFAQQVHEVHR